MVPLADTDQPSATEAAFLLVLDPAGTVSSESAPVPCARTGPVARSGTPAGGSAVSSTWPAVADPPVPVEPVPVEPVPVELVPVELAAPAISATGPEPLPCAGGQARAAEVTATCLVTAAAEAGPGAAGRTRCAAPAMTPSATSTAPAGAR